MKKQFTTIILFFLISLLISGCSFSPIQTKNISYYQLNTDNTLLSKSRFQRRKTNYTLFVSKPVANAGYDTNAMIYIIKPFELRSFAYNKWVDSPANMLMNVITDIVQQSNYFRAVTFPPSISRADFRLNTQLIMFQQEFLRPESQFHLVIQATLINNHTQRVIATHRFESIIPAPGNDPYSGVNAANIAANQIAFELTKFCIRFIH